MTRSLSLQSPIEAGSWDDLLLYYHYQKSILRSELSPSSDPMLKFKTPEEVGMPSIPGQDYEIFEWSLGGFSDLNPLQPEPATFKEWISTYLRYNYANGSPRFSGVIRSEPRLSINLPRFFERERELTYRKILNNFAVTAYMQSVPLLPVTPAKRAFIATLTEEIMLAARSIGTTPAEVLGEESTLPSWFPREGSSTPTLDDLNERIRGQRGGFGPNDTILTITRDLLNNMRRRRDDAQPRSAAAGPIFSALLTLISMEDILRLLAGSWKYQNPSESLQWSYYKTQQSTPFTTSAASREYLSKAQTTAKRASLSSTYNFYIPDYERAVNTPGIPELYLPNGYAYYILNNSIPDPSAPDQRIPPELNSSQNFPGINPNLRVPGRIRETAHNASDTVENILNLNGEIPSEAVQTSPTNNYYKAYSENIGTTTSTSPQITENIIFPATDSSLLGTVKDKERIFPFNIGVEFWRDSLDNHSAKIIYHNLRSVGILSGISGSIPNSIPSLVNTENLTHQNGRVVKGRAPAKTSNVNFYNFPEVMNFSADEEAALVKPLVLTENCLEGATGLRSHPWLIPSADNMPSEILAHASRSARKYSEIVDISAAHNEFRPDESTRSEAIGYKLTKRELFLNEENSYVQGQVIQSIMFGNTPASVLPGFDPVSTEDQIVKYIDTQIKYGKNYAYSLFEYRLIYGTEYELFVVGQDVPRGLAGNSADEIRASFNSLSDNQIPIINYRSYVLKRPKVELVEVPIYDREFYTDASRGDSVNYPQSGPLGTSFGLSYPPAKVLDTPPPPPDITVLPLKGNSTQVKIVMTPNAGSYKGENALPIIFIPQGGTLQDDTTNPLDILRYQTEYDSPPPEEQRIEGELHKVLALNYASEGIKEVTAIRIYRSTEINTLAPSLARAYSSFDPIQNPGSVSSLTLVNTLYAPERTPDEENGELGVVSYDMLDTIEPNVFYYYTCVAVDAHNNTSPPSPIYRVRLVLDKGLLIPEVEAYQHTPAPLTTSTRRFARFIQMQASPIQSNPFTERDDEGQVTSIRSLSSEEGQTSITDNRFIVRLTSKDTGRKFDIELKFNYQDTPIVDEEE